MRSPFLALGMLLMCAAVAAQTADPQNQAVVRSVTLIIQHKLSRADEGEVIQQIKSGKYHAERLREILDGVGYAYAVHGYIKIQISHADLQIRSLDIGREAVDITVKVDEGERYRLRQITFNGGGAFCPDELRRRFVISDGDIFNAHKIRAGVDSLRNLYISKGYLNFTPVPTTETEEASRMAALTIYLDQGRQFRFGEIEFEGVEPQPGAASKLQVAWKEHEGQVFDLQILESFWHTNADLLPPIYQARLGQGLEETWKQTWESPLVTLEVKWPVRR